MRYRLLSLLCIVLMTGCADSYTADEFNNNLVNKHTILTALINATDKQVSNYLVEGKKDSAIVLYERLISKIDTVIIALSQEQLPDATNPEPFRKAAIDYFESERNIRATYNKFTKDTLIADSLVQKGLDAAYKKADYAFKYFQYAQEKFAYDNGVKVQKDPFGAMRQ
jgi:hypothetical protein